MSKLLELKGSVLSISSLKIYQADLDAIQQNLEAKISQAPSFFKGLSLVIEPQVSGLSLNFLTSLVEFLRTKEFVVLGINSEDAALLDLAKQAGLAKISPSVARTVIKSEAPKQEVAAQEVKQEFQPAKIHRGAVRSGQQIYAPDGDLIILGSVNPGGEVVADGHVHIYGKLRGKAFAGAKGNAAAQLFVQDLDAELVCIAGCFQIADDIEKTHKNQAVSIVLQEDFLVYTSI